MTLTDLPTTLPTSPDWFLLLLAGIVGLTLGIAACAPVGAWVRVLRGGRRR